MTATPVTAPSSDQAAVIAHGSRTAHRRTRARVSTAAAANPPSAAPCSTADNSGDETDKEVVVMRRPHQPRLAASQAANHGRQRPLRRRYAVALPGQSAWVNAMSRRACLPAPL